MGHTHWYNTVICKLYYSSKYYQQFQFIFWSNENILGILSAMALFIVKHNWNRNPCKEKVCLLFGFFMSPFYKGIFTKSRAILDRFIYKSLKRRYNSFSDHLNFFFAHHYFLPCQWLEKNRQIQLLSRFSVSHFNFFIRSLAFCSNKYLLLNLLLVWAF